MLHCPPPRVDTAVLGAITLLCCVLYCADGPISQFPHSLFQPIVISLSLGSLKHYPAKRSLIVCRICVNRRLKTRFVNGALGVIRAKFKMPSNTEIVSKVSLQYCSFETCGEFTGNIHMNSPQENSPWGIPLGESDSLPQANW